MTLLKTSITHSKNYLTGGLISGCTSLLMTKYYTAVFNPAEFGILALYLVMFKYVASLVSLNLDGGSSRLYFDYKDTKRDEYLSTIFWLISFIAFFVFVLSLMFIKPISSWILPNSELIYFVTLLTGIAAVYVSFLTRVLYNEQKSISVLKHSVFQTVVNHSASVILISLLNVGILGRIAGQGFASLLNVLSLIRGFSKGGLLHIKLQFNVLMAKETFIYTLPSMISLVLGMAFLYADRFFLKYFIGDTAVGIYSLAFLIGQGLSISYEAITQSILPKVYNDMNKQYDRAIMELEKFSYVFYTGLILLTCLIVFLSPLIVSIFSNDSYLESATAMPFILVGFMMGGMHKIPALVLSFHKRIWFQPFLAVFVFGVNVFLNWWLIPIYGVVGSAFASFVGVFIYSMAIQIIANKYLSNKNTSVMLILYIIIIITTTGFFYG